MIVTKLEREGIKQLVNVGIAPANIAQHYGLSIGYVRNLASGTYERQAKKLGNERISSLENRVATLEANIVELKLRFAMFGCRVIRKQKETQQCY